jgi:hypothetical protein
MSDEHQDYGGFAQGFVEGEQAGSGRVQAGTDAALRQLQRDGGVDVESAREWLSDALSCLEEPLDGCSVGNAANQTWKALVALGHYQRDETHPCSDCGESYYERMGGYWLTDDEMWQYVVGDSTLVLCPRCFSRRARRAGRSVRWLAIDDTHPSDSGSLANDEPETAEQSPKNQDAADAHQ